MSRRSENRLKLRQWNEKGSACESVGKVGIRLQTRHGEALRHHRTPPDLAARLPGTLMSTKP